MTIEEKVTAVKELYARLDEHITEFQNWSGLGCKAGCSKCCFKSDIEATTLEFLPLAHSLYHEGTAEQWLEKLSVESQFCTLLDPSRKLPGMCTHYPHRALICRLFGYSARVTKYQIRDMVTCQTIKTEQTEKYNEAKIEIEQGKSVPVTTDYYMQLSSIDFNMAREFFPINEAIKNAIEVILQYYAYRS